jgi:hypothetical protein
MTLQRLAATVKLTNTHLAACAHYQPGCRQRALRWLVGHITL